jgi:two-component system, NarL family, sensor histidine kinase DesK
VLDEMDTRESYRPMFGGGVFRRREPAGYIVMAVWLGFLVFPIVNAVTHKQAAPGHAAAIVAATSFVATYFAVVIGWRSALSRPRLIALFSVTLAIAIGLTVFDRPGWGFLFTYCAACTALVLPPQRSLTALVLLCALAAGSALLGGADDGTAVGFVASTAGIGLLMVLVRDLRLRNDELLEARAELARMAVAEERERFARDLHDLLGHTLSVIALKAELAGRLLPERADDAAREIGDVESVARGALTEVRQAVSGYRQPTLDGELEGARVALSAAGISAEVTRAPVTLSPEVEAVLAWSVREGATNVIRHSGARRCSVTVAADLVSASVEVVDDGMGSRGNGSGAGAGGGAGNGLAGLAERAGVLRGRVDAGPRPSGGYGLRVTVPVAAS